MKNNKMMYLLLHALSYSSLIGCPTCVATLQMDSQPFFTDSIDKNNVDFVRTSSESRERL